MRMRRRRLTIVALILPSMILTASFFFTLSTSTSERRSMYCIALMWTTAFQTTQYVGYTVNDRQFR